MHVQTLASGSRGNSTLVRAGEIHLLLDAGLPLDELLQRLDAVRLSHRRIDHIALTHGHLDHARASGGLAKKAGARLHCPERLMRNRSIRAAPVLTTLAVGGECELWDARGVESLRLLNVPIPHDAQPTLAFRVEHRERVLVLITDMGHDDATVARELENPDLLVLEFNHDLDRLRSGPYAAKLKRRVAGANGHLSNEAACRMLRRLIGPRLHTLVLAHLSSVNNSPELALDAARRTLSELGREDVRVLVAAQDEPGPNLEV